MKIPNKKHDIKNIFISYTNSEKIYADKLARALKEDKGLKIIATAEYRQGKKFVETTRSNIRKADIVLSLLPEDEANSPNVLFEMGMAIALGKIVLPVASGSVMKRNFPGSVSESVFILKRNPNQIAAKLRDFLSDKIDKK